MDVTYACGTFVNTHSRNVSGLSASLFLLTDYRHVMIFGHVRREVTGKCLVPGPKTRLNF